MTKKDLPGSAHDASNTRPPRGAGANPAPEQDGRPLSLDYRASTPMPKWVHDVIDESCAIETEEAKKAGALGFMARALVNATLPYKDPKSPIFERRNGHYVLRMMGGNDNGLPYGVYPRLLMSWITTEAVRELVRWAFSHPQCKAITATNVLPDNYASQKVLVKAGFCEIAYLGMKHVHYLFQGGCLCHRAH